MMLARTTIAASRQWFSSCLEAWDRFWFTPRLPHTLGVLRIATGAMLLYAHLVLATDLTAFLGDDAWVNNETARQLHDGTLGIADWARSYLWHIHSPVMLWAHHALTILVTACFALGFLTRITAPAAWFLQLMYLHRLTGALFGLDQIMTYCAMYLMLAPCGSCFSVDAWLRGKLQHRMGRSRMLRLLLPPADASIATNIATRLLQIHLCVIYMFGGLSKVRGQSWWDGTALWYAVGNYEYQSIDSTWLVRFPRVYTAMTHLTVFWEVYYVALVWPRLTRPIAIGLAVMVHAGIATFLGMITFGTMMIAANLVFVEPSFLLRLLGRPGYPVPIRQVSPRDENATADSLEQREADLARLEESLRVENQRLLEKKGRMRNRESTYRDRVRRLKERERKIKGLVERRRRSSEDPSDSSSD